MSPFVDQLKTSRSVKAAGGLEIAGRPQPDPAVTRFPAERKGFLQKESTQAAPAQGGMKQEPTQLRYSGMDFHNGDRAGYLPSMFDDPDAIAWFRRRRKSGQGTCDIGLKGGIPPTFGGVQRSMQTDNRAQVTGSQVVADTKSTSEPSRPSW